MTAFCRILMVCWIPIILIIFVMRRPPRTALIYSVVCTWLILPPVSLEISGFPDYSKTVATSIGALLAVALFDGNRLVTFRPKWFDLPILVFSVTPMVSSILNDLGPYDGFSQSLYSVFWFGIPYLLGRVYLADRDGLHAAMLAIVVATLVYSVPTLWEVRMSPHLQPSIYGVAAQGFDPPRYGLGFRPRVFMMHGLELGLWIAFAAIFAYALWNARVRAEVWGISMGWVVAFLVFLGLATKSVGAIATMLSGIGILWATRRLGNPILLWILLAIPVVYGVTRTTGAWSGDNLVELVRVYIGDDRADSLLTRFINEDQLVSKALEKPFFGWGGHGRSRITNEYGKDISLTDGFWVIYLGMTGMVGLISVSLVFLYPQLNLLLSRWKMHWSSPEMMTIVAAFVFCGMFTIDSLLNSDVNPFYFMLIGGLSGFQVGRRSASADQVATYLELGHELAENQAHEEAEAAFVAAIRTSASGGMDGPADWIGRAEASRSLGRLLESQGRYDEAHEAYLAAVQVYEERAGEGLASPVLCLAWSEALESLARDLKAQGREADAETALRRSLEVLDRVMGSAAADDGLWRTYADRLNDLAWLLVMPDDPGRADPRTAVVTAERATALQPDEPCFWNTVGVARLQSGDDRGAVEAITRSIELSGSGTPFDYYVMAMACARLGDSGVGQQWFARGEQLRAEQAGASRDLDRIRAQAEAVIGDAESREATLALPGE